MSASDRPSPDAAWEYGVRHVNDPESWEPHRSGMGEEDARDWVRDFEADGGKPGAFIVVRRQIGAWEDA